MKHLNENKLIISVAGSLKNGTVGKKIKECLSDPLDWDFVLQLVRFTQGGGTLWRAVRSQNLESYVPEYVRETLKRDYHNTVAKNMFFDHIARQITDLFSDDRIEFIPMKGIHLASNVYDDPGTREMEDIDILIHPGDIDNARKILSGMGFNEEVKDQGSHYSFVSDHDQPVVVELHYRLFTGKSTVQNTLFHLTEKDVWSRVEKKDKWPHVMNLYDEIGYLTLHLFKEYFHKPKWIGDVDHLLVKAGNDLDWNCLIQHAVKYRFLKALLFVLEYLKVWFGRTLPCELYETCSNAGETITEKERKKFISITSQLESIHRHRFTLYGFLTTSKNDMAKIVVGTVVRKINDMLSE